VGFSYRTAHLSTLQNWRSFFAILQSERPRFDVEFTQVPLMP
jgi:hypothetical protein